MAILLWALNFAIVSVIAPAVTKLLIFVFAALCAVFMVAGPLVTSSLD